MASDSLKISVSLSVFNWIKRLKEFHRISGLMSATLIQRYEKNYFISRSSDYLKSYRLSVTTFYDCINTIYQIIKPFFDNEMSISEEYGVSKR